MKFTVSFILLLILATISLQAFVGISVDGVGLPAALAIPVDTASGASLSTSLTVTSMTIANNTASTQTIQIQDCQTIPFVLFDGTNGSTMAAGDKWFVPGPIRFTGCLKWKASSTSVQGTLTGVK